MDAASFRRYLQPSPTLRWHPWAPLAVLVLALIAAFTIGARLGYWYAAKELGHDHAWSYAFLTKVRIQEQGERPAMAAVREAQDLDRAVMQWASNPRTDGWQRAAAYVHDAVNKPVPEEKMRTALVSVAEFRLREFAPGSPRWHVDADWCKAVYASPGPVTTRYENVAVAYTKLLGRPVYAKQLAPAIPGGECK